MTYTGAFLYVAMTFMIIAASVIPQLAPENVNFWRVAAGVPALSLAAAVVIVLPKLSDKAFYPAVCAFLIPGFFVNLLLLFLTPATEAILFNLIAPVIFAGYFLHARELAGYLVIASGIALTPLFADLPGDNATIESWLVVYIPTMWAIAFGLHQQKGAVRDAIEDARTRARTDSLTGLANLRALREEADRMLESAKSGSGDVVGLLLVDLDNFKSANTLHGHLGGDHALHCIGAQLRRVAPEGSVIARVGGDEFAVLVRARSVNRVHESGEIFRSAVRAARPGMGLPGVDIDASVGAAVFPDDGRTIDELLGAADRAMYEVKDAHHAAAKKGPLLALSGGGERAHWHEDLKEHAADAGSRLGRFFRTRTQFARITALGWIFASLVVGASMAMPGADTTHAVEAAILLAAGIVVAGVLLVANPRKGGGAQFTFDVAALAQIGGLMAATGGATSPPSTMLILVIVTQAWFWERRMLAWRVIGPTIALLSPLAYQSIGGVDGITIVDGAAMYAEFTVGIVLIAAMYVNQSFLVGITRRATMLALTDPLTGVPNRRAFNAIVDEHLAPQSDGSVQSLAIVMIDLDNFKNVNTNQGHQAGDRVLREIASTLASVARADDCLARVGGDEFAAVLPGVGIDGAKALAERFVEAVGNTEIARAAGVGASAGFALCPLHGTTLDALISAADDALMSVKESGKGSARVSRVVTAV